MLKSTLILSLKILGRRKFFTFVSLFGICFTLVALMLVTAIIDHSFAARGPESDMDRMLLAGRMVMSGSRSTWNGYAGWGFLDRYARGLPGVDDMTVFSVADRISTFAGANKVTLSVRHADAEYWRLFHFRFLEGAPFTAADVEEVRRVAIINEATRRRVFGDAEAMGRTLELGSERYRVVGIVEDVSVLRLLTTGDVYLPLSLRLTPESRARLMGSYMAAFRLDGSLPPGEVQAEFASRLEHVEFEDPERYDSLRGRLMTRLDVIAEGILGGDVDENRTPLLGVILAAGALLFMALPALNLTNVNMSRIFERSSEIGVRKAFGASARHLAGQFLLENAVLCVLGGLLSYGITLLVLDAVERSGLIPHASFSVEPAVFLWGLLLTLVFSVMSGLGPAWRMSRLPPVVALRGGDR